MAPTLYEDQSTVRYQSMSKAFPIRLRSIAMSGIIVTALGLIVSAKFILAASVNAETAAHAKRQFQLGGFLAGHMKDIIAPAETLITTPNPVFDASESAAPIHQATGFATEQDLLGGLTGFMTNLHIVKSTESQESTAKPTASTRSQQDAQLLHALSEALLKVVNDTEVNAALLANNGNSADKESDKASLSRRNPLSYQILQGKLSLSSLSNVVSQVSSVDTGAAARLVDSVLAVLPVDPTAIASVIPQVASQESVTARAILPFVLPALGAALGQAFEPISTVGSSNTAAALNSVIWRGTIVVNQILPLQNYVATSGLGGILNQVAGVMCSAAQHLELPLCVMTQAINGLDLQLMLPCISVGSLPPQPNPSSIEGYAKSPAPAYGNPAAPWSVSTLPPQSVYSFPTPPADASPADYGGQHIPQYGFTPTPIDTQLLPPAQYTSQAVAESSPCSTEAPPAYTPAPLPPVTPSIPAYGPTSTVTPEPSPSCAHCAKCDCQPFATPNIYGLAAQPYPDSKDGPCPGRGYRCDECPDGWFCPPQQTQAQHVNCGLGWPCYHCSSGLFCIPPDNKESGLPKDTALSARPTPKQSGNRAPYALAASLSKEPVSPGWSYLGCFQDNPSRILQVAFQQGHNQEGLSSSKCIQHCEANEYWFAGTEYGKKCWCGTSIFGNAPLLPESSCSTPCLGNSDNHCGGSWAISVYSLSGPQSQPSQRVYRSFAELLASQQQ